MPTLTLTIEELPARYKEIPDVDDCHVEAVWIEDVPDAQDLWTPPLFPRRFAPLKILREDLGKGDDEKELDKWRRAFDEYEDVSLRFRWGEGMPRGNGVEMLPHQGYGSYKRECKWCKDVIYHTMLDCPVRRLQALATALKNGEAPDEHVKAIDLWHPTQEQRDWAKRMETR